MSDSRQRVTRSLGNSQSIEARFARDLRRARRVAAAARQRAQTAYQRVLQAEQAEQEAQHDLEAEARVQEPAMAQQLPPDQQQGNAQEPPLVLLRLADTNPYTNLSDLTTENGRRLWRQATEGLSELFDGTHKDHQVFTASLTNRFRMCNWFRFITFTVDGVERNLIVNPGLIAMQMVQDARLARSQVLDNPPDPTAANAALVQAFNNAVIQHLHCTMMYHFLINSIKSPLKSHISQKIMCGLVYEDGPTLLKYIQQKVRGRANKQLMLNAHAALNNLNLKEFKYNVKKFHEHVDEQVLTVVNNGGEVRGDGITAGLLETYKTCSNEEFKHHVRHIESLANDNDENLDYTDLMTKVETKYDALIKAKVWGKKDARDEQILALQAKISDLEKKRKRGNGRSNTRDTDKPPSNDKRRYAGMAI